MKPTIQERHEKQRAKLERAFSLSGWDRALKALHFVRDLEQGAFRKDGKTPKFHHHVSVSRLVWTLRTHLKKPEVTLAAAVLHDVLEDHGDKLTLEDLTQEFGGDISGPVWRLTKKYRGDPKPYESYFITLAACPVASVVKPADRAHNIQTMQGVFSREKQRAYVEEVSKWFFPLIRNSRRAWPEQYDAYENLKMFLRSQVDLLRVILGDTPSRIPGCAPPPREVPHVSDANRSLVYSDGNGPLK